MDILEDAFELVEDNVGTGLAIGLGAVLLIPKLIPALSNFVKPVAKSLVKGGILFYDKTVEALAEVKEVGEDIVAEAKDELAIKAEEAAKAAAVVQEGEGT